MKSIRQPMSPAPKETRMGTLLAGGTGSKAERRKL